MWGTFLEDFHKLFEEDKTKFKYFLICTYSKRSTDRRAVAELNKQGRPVEHMALISNVPEMREKVGISGKSRLYPYGPIWDLILLFSLKSKMVKTIKLC